MSIQKAVELVLDPNPSESIKTRAMFYLRCLDTEEAALALQQCITGASVLIDHEVAYILGQMKQPATIPFLFKVAEDRNCDPIVRHEAIEALGNFEDALLVPRIQQFLEDPFQIVSESAILAIKKLQESGKNNKPFSKYHSRDPAYPFEGSFEEAKELLLGKDSSLEDKYRAIFFMRDLNTPEAVEALAHGFKDPSDLLRHEIAYVFGQMENPLSVSALSAVLENPQEADIVRHEAAEALGNIGTQEAQEILEKYDSSEIAILKESSRVGRGISNNADEDYVDFEKILEGSL